MRPIHRSKTFWLGLLVIAFLAWAWRDSTRWSSTLRSHQYSFTQAGSGICLKNLKWSPTGTSWQRSQIHDGDPTWGQARFELPETFHATGNIQQRIYYVRDPLSPLWQPRSSAARHFLGMITSQIPDARAIFIPHWLLILTFLIPWTTFLLWRTRRMKRIPAPTAVPPARSSKP